MGKKNLVFEYYKHPTKCKVCDAIIEIKNGNVSEAKKQKFCSRSCAAKHNNVSSVKRTRTSKLTRKNPLATCKHCKEKFLLTPIPGRKEAYRARKYCDKCKYFAGKPSSVSKLTKDQVFAKYKTWQAARSQIRVHAFNTYMRSIRPKFCVVCGYEGHIEVCHILSVSQFEGETLISTINDIENLIALCPTHHWEFDSGILAKDKLTKAIKKALKTKKSKA